MIKKILALLLFVIPQVNAVEQNLDNISELPIIESSVYAEIIKKTYAHDGENFSQLYKLINSKLSKLVLNEMVSTLERKMHNDWGRYLYLQKFVTQAFGSIDICKKKFIVASLFRDFGIKILYGYSKSSCHILVPSNTKLYQLAYIYYEDKKYYALASKGVVEKISNVSIFGFDKQGRVFDFKFKGFTIPSTHLTFKEYRYPKNKRLIAFPLSESNLDLFKFHPQMDYIHYINAPISNELRGNLKKLMMPDIALMDDLDIAQTLMDFIHLNIEWSDDRKKIGYEKVQFFEETLFSQSGDCEDLVILYAKLLNMFLKRPLILLKYENHLALAIALNNVNGWQTSFDKKKYIIADPSIKDGVVGDIMPSLLNEPYEIIKLDDQYNEKI